MIYYALRLHQFIGTYFLSPPDEAFRPLSNRHTSKSCIFRSSYSCYTQLATTIHDFVSNFDRGVQTDIAILDFFEGI